MMKLDTLQSIFFQQVVTEHQDCGGLVLDLMDEPASKPMQEKEQLGTSGAAVNRLLQTNHAS